MTGWEKTISILEFGKRGSHQLTLSLLGSETKHVLAAEEDNYTSCALALISPKKPTGDPTLHATVYLLLYLFAHKKLKQRHAVSQFWRASWSKTRS